MIKALFIHETSYMNRASLIVNNYRYNRFLKKIAVLSV